jgi:hypothetical protein
MTTATAPATVTVACKGCGASFDRPVRRGRPQVWCEACRVTPFYERTTVPTAQAQAAPVPSEPVVPAIVATALQAHQATVEAAVQAVYAWWKSADGYKALIGSGMSWFDADTVLADKIRGCGALTRDASGTTLKEYTALIEGDGD